MAKKIILNQKEQAALNELKEILKQKFSLLDFRLYGSKARGESEADSDIDVLLILEKKTPDSMMELSRIVYDIILKYDSLISPVVFTRSEIEQGPFSESPLYKAAMKEGIPL